MARKNSIPLTAERLREVLHYDADTGVFTWRVRMGQRGKVGTIAGSLRKDGRWTIRVDGRLYMAHRLVWFWITGAWPTHELDHIDGNTLNNRIENLRDVTHSINMQNQKRAQSSNKTRFLGVSQHHGKFQAAITLNKKPIHIGTFDTPALAHSAYLEAKRLIHLGNTL